MRRVKAVLDPAGHPQSRQAPARGRHRLAQGDVRRCRLSCAPATRACGRGGDETLAAVQRAAAAAGQFLPVDADGAMTVRELLQRRDGGPIEARYGRLRDRVLAAGIDGLSLGSEAVKDVAGYDLRRMLLGSAPVDWAVFRLARLPERRERLLARGGDAFALAEALRADAAEPAALVVLAARSARHRRGLRRRRGASAAGLASSAARARRAQSSRRSTRPRWLALCAGLPPGAVRMAGREARVTLPAHAGAWAYDAGRRLALVAPRSRASRARPPGAARRAPSSWRRSSRQRWARDGDSIYGGAARALRRARAPVRLVRAVPSRLPHVRPARGRVGRPARPDPHHAAPRRRRPLGRGGPRAARPLPRLPRLRGGLPVRRAVRRDARDRPRRRRADAVDRRCGRCSRSCAARACSRSRCAPAGRSRASSRAPRGAAAGRSIPTPTVTWERRRPGGPPAVVLRGCVMREAFAGVQQAAVDSLAAAGYDVDRGPRARLLRRTAPAQRRARDGRGDARAAACRCARRRHPRLDGSRLRRGSARARRARARSQRGARAGARTAAGQRRRARRGLRRLPPAARPARARGAARAAARRGLRAGRAGRRRSLLRRRRCVLVHTAGALTAARAQPRRGDPRERRATSSAAATPAARCSCAARCARRSSTCAWRIPPSSPSRRPEPRR